MAQRTSKHAETSAQDTQVASFPSDACGLPGLTAREVADRVAQGKSNVNTDVKTKSVPQIVRDHTFTLFNGVNLIMAILVLSTGSMRNLLFIWVVFANLGIGIFQEIRSKRIVDRLTILATRPVRVRRDGVETKIPLDQVVLDDLVCLSHGSQVPADSEVVWGDVTMNEGLLTGESKPVEKQPGDMLLSGSFVDSGAVVARVVRVGAEGFAARINSEAKYVKHASSEIMGTLSMIISFATIALVPLGVGLYLRTRMGGADYAAATLSMVAAVVGMIPQGLVLLTSTVLAIATARLAMQQVLVQQLYCIETLARVDVLCLDKTGTITTGSMEVADVVASEGADNPSGALDEAKTIVATIAQATSADANETGKAILAYVKAHGVGSLDVERTVPFSSARKYSGCVTSDGRCFVMGAAQFVMGERFDEVRNQLECFPHMERVVLVATCKGFGDAGSLVGPVVPVGFVRIRDQIRPTAHDTLEFFKREGVTLNVISGDDPATVSAIAKVAGVPGADDFVDASTLKTPEDIAHAVARYHVFGRVTPQQKRELMRALKADGHTVAMTGDGVNDVLALKEADCSVAMAAGSDAARNVSEIVLVDNDFAHMPEVVAEGRRSINNLQRSASLFLVKTVFSAVLALVCIVHPPYPFLPVQMSLLSLAIIGMPSFVLALEPNHDRVTGNFLANVLSRSLPASLGVVLSVVATIAAQGPLGFSAEQVSTLCMLLTSLVGLSLIIRISIPMTPLRIALSAAVVLIMVFGVTFMRPFFEVSALTPTMTLFFLVTGACALVLFNVLYTISVSHVQREGRFVQILSDLEEKNGKRSVL